MKICGPLLIICGIIGFYYVIYGGDSVEPKDTLSTVMFIAGGIYFTWLGFYNKK